jgi:hypothetical protein
MLFSTVNGANDVSATSGQPTSPPGEETARNAGGLHVTKRYAPLRGVIAPAMPPRAATVGEIRPRAVQVTGERASGRPSCAIGGMIPP